MENVQVMVMLFIIVVIGYVANRCGRMGGEFDKQLSVMVVDVLCPLLIVSSVMGGTMPNPALILPLVAVSCLTYLVLTVVAFLLPRFLSPHRDEQGILGFALMFANVGFIGYPVVASIFGQEAVFYAALLNMPNTFFVFTVGALLIKGERGVRRFDPRVLVSPSMLAAYLSILIVVLDVRIPPVLAQPLGMVGNMTVPAALLIIGSSMAQLPLRRMLGNAMVYLTSFLRLVLIPVGCYFLFRELGFDPLVVNINTVVIGMPVATYGTIFCLKFGHDTSLMTELTFVTTLASVATIPLLTALFR